MKTELTIGNLSIHPRNNIYKDNNSKKKNTCKPRSSRNGGAGGKKLRKATRNLRAKINDYNRTQENNKSNPNAYTKPGSMKV